MDSFKIAAAGIICAILCVTVRNQKPELAPAVTVAAGIVLFLGILPDIGAIIAEFDEILKKCRLAPEYFYAVIKLTAIAYITKFAAEVCRDCSENAIASKIELAGKITVLAMTAPIIGDFLNLIIETLNNFG